MEKSKFAQQTTSLGVFGQVAYKFSDKLKVTGGLRYSHEKRAAQVFEGLPNPIDAARDNKASNVSGDISATYEIVPRVNLYARYATGYQAPSLARNFTEGDITVAKAQTTRSFEAGIKGL
nr:TonB-dependent receptor [Sphingomonas populi]